MLLKPYTWNGFSDQKISLGDVLSMMESITTLAVTNALTITGPMLMNSVVQRTTTGAGTATIDTAANILASLAQNIGNTGIDNNTTWRLRWIQNAAFTDTLTATAHTGITVTNGVVNASSVKEFLVNVTNGSPAQTVNGVITNASAVITGMTFAQTQLLSVGMVVTNAQNGLQDATILSVQPGTGVTMSTTATSGQVAPVALNFSPTITITGLGQGLL